MGACFSCLPHRFFLDDHHQASEGSSGSRWQRPQGSRWQRRCCRFVSVVSCCGMYEVLFQTSEEEDEQSGPLLQSTGHLDGTSALSAAPTAHTRNVDTLSNLLRHDKMCTNLLQTQIGETQYRNGSGSGWHRAALVIERAKVNDNSGDQKLTDKVSKLPLSSKNEILDVVTSLLDDEDICPTCLDGYDQENPKIVTKCGHHFHLSCIFEWMERSNRCPLCDQEMIFNESL